MRRTIATLLITGLLSASVPIMARDGDRGGRDSGGDITFVKIVKTIIRHLLPVPTDDGNNLGPPKP